MEEATKKRLGKEWLLIVILVGLAFFVPVLLGIPRGYITRYTYLDSRGKIHHQYKKTITIYLGDLQEKYPELKDSGKERGGRKDWTSVDTERVWSVAIYAKRLKYVFRRYNPLIFFTVFYGGFWLIRSIKWAVRVL